MKIQSVFKVLFVLILSATGFSQTKKPNSDINPYTGLIQEVSDKSEKSKDLRISQYQYSFKTTVEDEKTHKTRDWTYELYCADDGRSNCQRVLTGKDGKQFSDSKINKSREKASKNLAADSEFIENGEYSYGFGLGYRGLGKNVWVDPSFYLRDCQVLSSEQQNIDDRAAVLIRLGDCNVDKETWKQYVTFMPKTEADIWIDKQDKDVIKMDIYAKKEFSGETNRTKPLITYKNKRMPEGYWLNSKVRLETTNKLVFPTMKDNFQFDFFDYKRPKVDVEYKAEKPNKDK